MTDTEQKSMWKLMPFAPLALGIVLTACAALADHNSTAYYNEAWMPASAVAGDFAGPDAMPIQVSTLGK